MLSLGDGSRKSYERGLPKSGSIVYEIFKCISKTWLNRLESGEVRSTEVLFEKRFFIRDDGSIIAAVVFGDNTP